MPGIPGLPGVRTMVRQGALLNLFSQKYPGAVGMFSFRKLNSRYSGYCMKIRRSTDNTEQNIGFKNGVLDDFAALLFVGVGNGFVSCWYDQSGLNNHATQTVLANQPAIITASEFIVRDGLRVIDFNGTSQGLQADSIAGYFSGEDKPISVFSAMYNGANAGTESMITMGNSGSAAPFYSIATATVTLNNAVITKRDVNSVSVISSFLINNLKSHLLSIVDSGTVCNAFVDKAQSLTNGSLDTGAITLNTFSLGYLRRTGIAGWFNGGMNEVIVYPSNQSVKRAEIETDINTHLSSLFFLADANMGEGIVNIAGSDAPPSIKTASNLVLTGTDDAIAVNTYLATLPLSTKVNFYRTVNVKGFLSKKLNHNWKGCNAVIKMLPNLTTLEYVGGIVPEPGNHNYTYIKGFELDGNELNNLTASQTAQSYGLGYETYDNLTTPTSVQVAINLSVENIYSRGWIRSCLLPGSGWNVKNVRLGNSRQDHLLYVAGVENVTVNDIYMYGKSYGALHIAGSNPSFSPWIQPNNININNLTMCECTSANDSAMLMVRTRSPAGGSYTYPCKNVNINGVTVKNTAQYNGVIFMVGHSYYDFVEGGQCENISITNINATLNLGYFMSKMQMSKNIRFSGVFNITNLSSNHYLHEVVGGTMDANNYSFKDSSYVISNYDANGGHYAIVGVRDNADIKGLDLSGITIVNSDVFERWNHDGTANIIGLISNGLTYNKAYNPDNIPIS